MTRILDLDAADALLDITVTGNSASIFVKPSHLVVAGLVGPVVLTLFTNAKVVLRDKNGEVTFIVSVLMPIFNSKKKKFSNQFTFG